MAKRTYIRSGGTWVDITSGAGIPRYAIAPTSPSPTTNQVYYNTTDLNTYIYNGATWDKIVPAASTTAAGVVQLGTSTPAAVGTASAGTGTAAAKDDHVHANSASPSFTNVTLTAASGSKDQITISDTTAGAGLTIGADTNLYRSAADVLKSDANFVADNIFPDYATTATAAGTTTLTSASKGQQYFTGTSTQTITLPVTSTLALGWRYRIVNNSTGTLTVNSSGANLVGSVYAGDSADVTCVLTSGTTAASWDFDVQTNSGMRLVSSTTLGTATQTWTISSIPGTYKTLIIYGYNIKSSTTASATLSMQINGLSTSTYSAKWIVVPYTSTVSSNASPAATTSWSLDTGSGALASTTGLVSATTFRMEIPNYAGSIAKTCLWHLAPGQAQISPAGMVLGAGGTSTTAAITSISLVSSSATNLIGSGAVVDIYGVY
jgi:hypothetical protein